MDLLRQAIEAVAEQPGLKAVVGYYLKDLAPSDDASSLAVKTLFLETLI